jgi:hypothetical protein
VLCRKMLHGSHHARRRSNMDTVKTDMFSPPHLTRTRPRHTKSRLSLTHLRTLFLNSGGFSRHSLAASTFAGDSSFGLDSIEITERRILSGDRTGDQRSEADS